MSAHIFEYVCLNTYEVVVTRGTDFLALVVKIMVQLHLENRLQTPDRVSLTVHSPLKSWIRTGY